MPHAWGARVGRADRQSQCPQAWVLLSRRTGVQATNGRAASRKRRADREDLSRRTPPAPRHLRSPLLSAGKLSALLPAAGPNPNAGAIIGRADKFNLTVNGDVLPTGTDIIGGGYTAERSGGPNDAVTMATGTLA